MDSPAQVVAAEFTKVLEEDTITTPTARFEIVKVPDLSAAGTGEKAASPGAGTKLVLRTDLEPDVAKVELAHLREKMANDRDLLFERITMFGGTVAGETRTLAMLATVASWVIIIVYLWWRVH